MAKLTASQQKAIDRAARNCCIVCNTESRGLRRGLCVTDYTRFRTAWRQVPRDQRKQFEELLIKEGQLMPSRQGQRGGLEEDVFQRFLTQFLKGNENDG